MVEKRYLRARSGLRRSLAIVRARGRRVARRLIPQELVQRVHAEWVVGRAWLDRAVVLAFAVATGALVVGFTMLAEWSIAGYRALSSWGESARYLMLLWTPAVTAAVVWVTMRWAPGAAGSGIPQVVRALDDDLTPPRTHDLVALRLSLSKIGLVSAGMLGGLSIGREGPTVQVGAGVMLHARRWLSPGCGVDAHDLMVAGSAAGIAAAFNTPLGGIVFALEQLTRRRHLTHSTLVIASIVLAGLVAVSVFGNETHFGKLKVQDVPAALVLPGLLVAVAAGIAGGLFSRLIVLSMCDRDDRFGRWRRAYPYRFAAACAFAVAVIGFVTSGTTAGAGYQTTRALLEGQGDVSTFYTPLKFVATWLSTWSGVPAGVFAPSLAIGAGIGHDVAQWIGVGAQQAIPLIAVGMAGFLAASTGGPITAFIIVMEMVSGHAMVLSLMAGVLVASGAARLLSRPMYVELAGLLPVPGAERSGRSP
jgi:H+/Cl- antiporter ClcA